LARHSPGNATETDIFSAFDRIRADDRGRRQVVVLFSDMLQSTSHDVDMGKARMNEQTIRDVIQSAAKRHHWNSATLAGVSVRCLLPGVGADARPVPNDRVILKQFWGSLCRLLGGSLDGFDTQL
jgi:hypothetical protein